MAQYNLVRAMSEESRPGCEEDENAFSDDQNLLEKSIIPQIQKPFHRKHLKPIAFHSLCFCLNLVILVSTLRWARSDCPFGVYGPELVYSLCHHQPSDIIQLMTMSGSTSTRSYRL